MLRRYPGARGVDSDEERPLHASGTIAVPHRELAPSTVPATHDAFPPVVPTFLTDADSDDSDQDASQRSETTNWTWLMHCNKIWKIACLVQPRTSTARHCERGRPSACVESPKPQQSLSGPLFLILSGCVLLCASQFDFCQFRLH